MNNIRKFVPLLMALAWCATGSTTGGQNLLPNGSFDDPEDGFKGWIIDYAWSGNSHYEDNADKISLVAQPGRKGKAVHLEGDGGAGVKMESVPIPFDVDYAYECTLDIKGGPYRVYFAGYKWKPGIRPHENPELGELRTIYKSKAATGEASSWKQETVRLPGVKPSPMALEHLRQVRFITAYVYFIDPGFIDNASVTRTRERESER